MVFLVSVLCSFLLAIDWGMGYSKAGEPPAGSMPSEALAQYGALYMGDPEKKTIYLTFDAGYESGSTAKMLDTLKEKGVKTAFFVVGNFIDNNPDLVRRLLEEGHTVLNHTNRHPDMSQISDRDAWLKELNTLAAKFKEVTGRDMPKIYRPPSGKFSERCLKYASEEGYKTVFWSVAYVDWMQDSQPSREAAMSKLTKRIHPGAIILLHNTSGTNAEILGELIDVYREMGYEFGVLEELLEERLGA